MGTRGLTSVKKDGEFVVAQYGQWDHYPSSQGITILEFLRGVDIEHFKKQLDKVKFLTKKDDSDMEQSAVYNKKYPFLSRDHGGAILQMINDYKGKKKILLENSSDFKKDGLFCEYAYDIDLDKGKFIVQSGSKVLKTYSINKLPSNEKFLKDLEGK